MDNRSLAAVAQALALDAVALNRTVVAGVLQRMDEGLLNVEARRRRGRRTPLRVRLDVWLSARSVAQPSLPALRRRQARDRLAHVEDELLMLRLGVEAWAAETRRLRSALMPDPAAPNPTPAPGGPVPVEPAIPAPLAPTPADGDESGPETADQGPAPAPAPQPDPRAG